MKVTLFTPALSPCFDSAQASEARFLNLVSEITAAVHSQHRLKCAGVQAARVTGAIRRAVREAGITAGTCGVVKDGGDRNGNSTKLG